MKFSKFSSLSNDELYNLFIELSIKLNRTPSKIHMNSKYGMPSAFLYYKRFNVSTWNELLKLFNFQLNFEYKNLPIKDNDEKINLSINELKEMANSLKRLPTVKEYEKQRINGLSFYALSNCLKMKYNEICNKYLSEYKLNIKYSITKEEIENAILNLANKLNKTPIFKEFSKFYNSYSEKTIRKYCNKTYNELLVYLNLIPNKDTIHYSDEELLFDFYNYFLELKRIPYTKEIDKNKKMVCSYIYLKRFGSYKNICDLLNIDWNIYYKKPTYGKILFDDNGNLCKSYMEFQISNYFINNNINFNKEPKYSELIESNKNIFD